MCVPDRHEIGGLEEVADRDLVRNGPAPRLAELASQIAVSSSVRRM